MKRVVLGILCLLCFTLLAACGRPKPPSEEEIAINLPDEIKSLTIKNCISESDQFINEEEFMRVNPPDTYVMEVKSVFVERRQTNEKEDIIYCTVDLENTYYCCTKYLELRYNYYDQGGWILDEWNEYAESKLELKENPIDSERIAQIVGRDYTIVEVVQNLEMGVVRFIFEIGNSYTYARYEGTAIMTCQFDGTSWKYELNNIDGEFIWDIVGRWEYSKITESWDGTDELGVDLTIESFDQNMMVMDGTWNMRCNLGPLWGNAQTTISLNDAERVSIREKDASLIIYDKVTYSYVKFGRNKVEATYGRNYFRGVELVRTELPA